MEKIIIQALRSKFDNAELIAKVANATSNPQVAVEMLLGIHEPMTPDQFGMVRKDKYRDDRYYVVREIKELENQIVCDTHTQKKVTAWYKTKEDYNTDTNRIYDRISDYYTSKDVPTKGVIVERGVVYNIEDIAKHQLSTSIDLAMFINHCESTIDVFAKPVAEFYDGTDVSL